jgi:hypothetical protein
MRASGASHSEAFGIRTRLSIRKALPAGLHMTVEQHLSLKRIEKMICAYLN